MTNKEFYDVCIETVEELRNDKNIPWDTGNIATKSMRYDMKDDVFHLYMDLDIAPYVPYTNEPWVSPKWNGKKNPNEMWWQRFVETFMERLAVKLNGEVKKE